MARSVTTASSPARLGRHSRAVSGTAPLPAAGRGQYPRTRARSRHETSSFGARAGADGNTRVDHVPLEQCARTVQSDHIDRSTARSFKADLKIELCAEGKRRIDRPERQV